MATPKFNEAQRDKIHTFMIQGYSNDAILKKIDEERRKGILYPDDDETMKDEDGTRTWDYTNTENSRGWPIITPQAISYYRQLWTDQIDTELQYNLNKTRDLALARRSAYLRRLQKQIEDTEEIIESNNKTILEYLSQGVLTGIPYTIMEDPNVIEVGQRLSVRDLRKVIPDVPVEDPRYQMVMDLLNVQPKWIQQLAKMMQLFAQVSGLQNQNRKESDEKATIQERDARLKQLFETLRESAPIRTRRNVRSS